MLSQASKYLFEERFSPEAIKGQYNHAYDTFTYILALEGFMGGGGDGAGMRTQMMTKML